VNRNVRIALAVLAAALVALAIVYVAGGKSPPREPEKTAGFDPKSAPSDAAAAPPPSAVDPALMTALEAGVDLKELHDWRIRIAADLCPKAGEQVNKLEGRNPTDPKAVNQVSLCLQYGNVAWYKCLLNAKTAEEGRACTRRFLAPPP